MGWLSWLRRRKDDCRVFRYHDGREWVKRDPQVLLRNLLNRFDPDGDAKRIIAGDEDAWTDSVAAAREVFSLHAWDGRAGLTEEESYEIINQLLDWFIDQKKSTATSSSPPQSTESTSPSSGRPTTARTAPSGTDDVKPSLSAPTFADSEPPTG